MATTVIGDLFVRLGVDLTEMNRGFASAEGRLEKFGTQMFFLGSRITAGVSLPFAAAAGAVTKWGMDFDQAMTESLAIMSNVGPGVRSQMESVAKSVVDFTKYSAEEGAKGFYSLASAGLDAQTMMGALPIVARFAQAGLMDMAKASDFLASAQAAMGNGMETSAEKVEQMGRVADVLTLANNRALGTIQDFAEALTNKAGAALRLYHKDVEEGVAVLAAYAEQGLKGKAAGQQLMMVMRDLGTQALKHADAFAKFNISVYDSVGNMKNMADIIEDVEVATSKMSDAETQSMLLQLGIPQRSVNATKALIGYSMAIREHEAALRQAGGTTKEVADNQMKSLTNQVMQLYNQFKNVGIEIFESFLPTFTNYVFPVMKMGVDMFKSLGASITALPEPVKALAVAAGLLLIALGPVVAFIGSMSLLAAAALKGIGALSGGLSNFATSMGIAAGGVKFMVLEAEALNAAMLSAYISGVAAANAQGIFGAAAIDAGLAAQAEVVAVNELNAAQAASTAGMGLWGRIAMVATNPLTLIAAGTLAAASAYKYFTATVDENGHRMTATEAVTSTVSDAFGVLTDAISIAATGYKDLWQLIGSALQDAFTELDNTMRRLSGTTKDAGTQNTQTTAAFKDGVRSINDQTDSVNALTDAWRRLKLETELRGFNPEAEAARMNKEALGKVPKLFQGFTPTYKVPWGALAADPYKAFREMQDKLDRDAGKTGSGIPTVPPDHPPKKSDAEKMFEDLSGENLRKNIDATAAAFRKLVAAGKDVDPAVHERMWEAYKKLRVETSALVPEFEGLFKVEIQAHEEAARMAAAAAGFGDAFGDAAAAAIHGMGGLHPLMTQVSYDSSKAMTAMEDMVNTSAAKLSDAETELHRFSESSGTAHRSTLKSNLRKIEQDQNEHYAKALRGLATADGAQYNEYVNYLNNLKASDKEYLRVYEANESGKYAASIGVNQRLLKEWEKFSQAQRDQIIATREEWLNFTRSMQDTIGIVGELGNLFTAVGGGMGDFGAALSFAAKNMDDFLKAGEEIQSGNLARGITMAATATVNAVKQMSDTGSRAGRAAQGAEIGFMLGGGVGAAIGAAIGLLMKDPAWKKLQDTVHDMWGVSVTKELAKTIEADSKVLGGDVNAMLAHMGEIIAAGGGLTAANVGQWASRLGTVFSSLQQGTLSSSQAADILDQSFGDLVKTGTTTNGLISEQISQLIVLERQYKTGSAAIKDFVDAQLGMVASGFNKIAKGTFGPLVSGAEDLDRLEAEQTASSEKILKLKAQISDYERDGVKNDKQRVALMLARIHLAAEERKLAESQLKSTAIQNFLEKLTAEKDMTVGDKIFHVSPEAQEQFDRMGRLALTTFNALIGSGMSYRDALNLIGDGLDILIGAQKEFGLAGSDAFDQLMRFRDFANVHPELMDELDGLSQMMRGLSNTSFLTNETFNDLGDTAADVFGKMVEGGLTSDEALMMMQPQLQLLWELQKKYGFAVDETTQKILDLAEANHVVGAEYMSANDKMVLGIDKLNKMFELFLKHLGVDIPAEAEVAAASVEDAFSGVNPQVDVDIHYHEHGKPDPEGDHTPELATGGVLTRPTHVLAGEAGAEAIIPLDRLFEEVKAMSASEKNSLELTVLLDGEVLTRKVVKNIPAVLSLRGV